MAWRTRKTASGMVAVASTSTSGDLEKTVCGSVVINVCSETYGDIDSRAFLLKSATATTSTSLLLPSTDTMPCPMAPIPTTATLILLPSENVIESRFIFGNRSYEGFLWFTAIYLDRLLNFS